MAAVDNTPSEFGGQPGRLQMPVGDFVPEYAASDNARLERATDPTDPGDSADAALLREWRAEGRMG